MIEVRGVSRQFDGLTAVDEVSFDIGKGEIVGLLGHNGAGKSTVMKMLTGYLEPTAGDIRIGGHDMRREPAAIRRMIGYLPENCPLYPEMRVLDYLYFEADLKGIAPASQGERVLDVLQRTQLEARAASRIGTLSRGLRQRVGVAQALLAEPRILVLDEPANGLDPTQIEQMQSLIREAAGTATVIVSTHILQQVEAVCDRVLIMRNGRLVVDRPLEAPGSTSRLRVVVDTPGEAVAALLGDIGAVEPDGAGYLLACEDGETARTSLQVSRLLAEEGVGLIELRPERHSLEQLFRQAQASGEQPGA
jgi:ABC-2 type transport system ATP-binding protein